MGLLVWGKIGLKTWEEQLTVFLLYCFVCKCMFSGRFFSFWTAGDIFGKLKARKENRKNQCVWGPKIRDKGKKVGNQSHVIPRLTISFVLTLFFWFPDFRSCMFFSCKEKWGKRKERQKWNIWGVTLKCQINVYIIISLERKRSKNICS